MIDNLAGIVGVDASNFTLRQLSRMADAKCRHAWSHTSALMALIANCHRKANSRPFTPDAFSPYGKTKTKPKAKADISALKVFLGDGNR